MHFEQDRVQRKDHVDNLIVVLNKLAAIDPNSIYHFDGRQQSINGVNDANKVLRLPRWTKQEINILL
ncbi:hypothetical protein H5410_045354 [Solanum commersonii]|uniref:Uncharacterized protein n=1 Tax=Solanum commersonii TaxID=4109 RepID=A0A9J5XDF5_SOLCO|nr:hypothetical protein H5410_045354 [Solanum commersonii]